MKTFRPAELTPLTGKVAAITGGASGIGRAAAFAFAGAGARTIVADLNIAGAEVVASAIETGGGSARAVHADVSRPEGVQTVVDEAIRHFGSLDYAFNNAGMIGPSAPTAECTLQGWENTLRLNLTGVWLCMRAQIPIMLEQGGGAIVNCASAAGLVGFAGVAAYVASKHGVIGLTRAAALEYAQSGVRVNAVCPGVIRTPMVEVFTEGAPEVEANLVAGEPMGRMGTAEEVAAAVLWLCSDAASFVTGHAMAVDGGLLSQGGQRATET
ncbi:MAG: SDR family oxidoreductase [Actinomycetia bacterium]|nr:SDR family oxidoreductase [Actinomycetes bacterium]